MLSIWMVGDKKRMNDTIKIVIVNNDTSKLQKIFKYYYYIIIADEGDFYFNNNIRIFRNEEYEKERGYLEYVIMKSINLYSLINTAACLGIRFDNKDLLNLLSDSKSIGCSRYYTDELYYLITSLLMLIEEQMPAVIIGDVTKIVTDTIQKMNLMIKEFSFERGKSYLDSIVKSGKSVTGLRIALIRNWDGNYMHYFDVVVNYCSSSRKIKIIKAPKVKINVASFLSSVSRRFKLDIKNLSSSNAIKIFDELDYW